MPLTQHPPKDEDEEHQQHAEGGHVVHGFHEDDELALEGRHEADQLQHPHQPKGPQDREAPALLAHDLPHAEGGKKRSVGDEKAMPDAKAQRRGREGEGGRRMGSRKPALGREELPMPPVGWMLARLTRSRAPPECQEHACKSVAAAAGAITAFARAKSQTVT